MKGAAHPPHFAPPPPMPSALYAAPRYPTQASDIHSASSADTGVQLVWARLHEEMVYFRRDVLDGLLSIDIAGYALLGKYSVDFGAVIGRQFPVGGSDILLQLFLVAHAYQRHRNGRISQNPRNRELGDRFLIARSQLFQPSCDPQFLSERIPFKKRQTKRIALAAPIPVDKGCLFGKGPGE